jgi:hypothetical protein
MTLGMPLQQPPSGNNPGPEPVTPQIGQPPEDPLTNEDTTNVLQQDALEEYFENEMASLVATAASKWQENVQEVAKETEEDQIKDDIKNSQIKKDQIAHDRRNHEIMNSQQSETKYQA